MPNQTRSARRRAWAIALAALVAACSSDDAVSVLVPTDDGPTTTVCNPAVAGSHLEQAPIAKLAEYAKFNIYPASYSVGTPDASNKAIVFSRLTDALAAVRAARIARGETRTALCRITITVPAGTLRATTDTTATDPTLERLPWVIDVPDITIRGALFVQRNVLPTGNATYTTRIVPTPALRATPITEPIFIVNSHPDLAQTSGDGATIEGFTLTTGHAAGDATTGGQGVLGVRASGITVRGNIFAGNFSERVDLRAASGSVIANHMSGPGATCSICIAGPGSYLVSYNRLVGGGLEGLSMVSSVVLASPPIVEPYAPPGTSAQLTVEVSSNEISGFRRLPVGTAFRVGTVGLGSPNVAGSAKVIFNDNVATGNTFGLILEAAFPVAGGILKGDLDFSMEENHLSGNCQADMYVAFTRHAVGMGQSATPRPYLKNSTYTINAGYFDVPLSEIWIAHPAGFGNALIYNGTPVANVMRTAYDASRTC